MAGVVAVCLGGGLFAFTRRGEAFGRPGPGNVAPRAAAFWIAVTLLALARAKVAFPILLLDRFAPGWGWLEITALGLYAAWLTGL